jgi:hypothetical protein
MCGQVTQRILTGLLGGLLLGGCGSGGTHLDAPVPPSDSGVSASPDAPAAASCPQPDASLGANCDEDAMGVDYCIINPGTTVGGGTPVARQNPVPYPTCKL